MSESGKAWSACYERNMISWCSPEKLNREHFERFSRSEWIQSLIEEFPQKGFSLKILEAGCGLGIYAIAMAIKGYSHIDAFDYNEAALKMGRGILGNIQKQITNLDIRFFQDNLLNIKLPTGSYDFVFNQAVLEYFCDENERKKALSEMVRVAKSGGKVALIVQHTKHPFHAYWKKIGWPGYVDQPPVTDWSPKILRENLLESGLTDIRVSGLQPWKSLFFWPLWHKKFWITEQAVYLLGRLLEKLPCTDKLRARYGIQLVGVGTKP